MVWVSHDVMGGPTSVVGNHARVTRLVFPFRDEELWLLLLERFVALVLEVVLVAVVEEVVMAVLGVVEAAPLPP